MVDTITHSIMQAGQSDRTDTGEGSHGSILNGNYAATWVTSAWKSTVLVDMRFLLPVLWSVLAASIAKELGVPTLPVGNATEALVMRQAKASLATVSSSCPELAQESQN